MKFNIYISPYLSAIYLLINLKLCECLLRIVGSWFIQNSLIIHIKKKIIIQIQWCVSKDNQNHRIILRHEILFINSLDILNNFMFFFSFSLKRT
jgi:hypothetical protein